MMLPAGPAVLVRPHGARSRARVIDRISGAAMTIVFVNTRAQAELMFQALWKLNAETLPIALHHGSLDSRAAPQGRSRDGGRKAAAVVATSSLDLGIDWGGVDQVIQVGAPKGVSRLLQRVGRANHRMDEASRAILVPANRFEVLDAKPPCSASPHASWTATRRGPVGWTSWPSTLAHRVQRPVPSGCALREVTGPRLMPR